MNPEPTYFAEIQNGVVVRVIVADQAFIDSGLVGDASNWKETKVDGTKSKNYAGIGYEYDQVRDAFIPPKEDVTFVFNEEKAQYEAPIEYPKDGKDYIWSKEEQDWIDPKTKAVVEEIK